MLVLTRRVGQVIYIGNDIKITVIGFEQGQARIGIEAPKSVAIDRAEIRAKKDAGIPPPNKNEQYVEL